MKTLLSADARGPKHRPRPYGEIDWMY
jgi:hypothetical protein